MGTQKIATNTNQNTNGTTKLVRSTNAKNEQRNGPAPNTVLEPNKVLRLYGFRRQVTAEAFQIVFPQEPKMGGWLRIQKRSPTHRSPRDSTGKGPD